MTVADNIEFALRARRVRARGTAPAARGAAAGSSRSKVTTSGCRASLSGGQQQRVALARALAHEPRVLLLDEPFGALDAKIRDELRRAIREIQRAVGITTMLVTHDQEEAFSMADRIGVMDRGRLQEVGEPRALYQRPARVSSRTFLGAANLIARPLRLSRRPARRIVSSRSTAGPLAAQRRRGRRGRAPRRRGAGAACATCSRVPVVGSGNDRRAAVRRRHRAPAARGRGDRDARERAAARRGHVLASRPSRTARDVESLPLAIGQQVYVGFKRHARAADADQQLATASRAATRPRKQLGEHADRARARGAHAHRAAALSTTSHDATEQVRGLADRRARRRRQRRRARSRCSSAARGRCWRSATGEPRRRAHADLRRAVVVRPRRGAGGRRELGAPPARSTSPCSSVTKRRRGAAARIATCSTCAMRRCALHGLDIRTETFRGSVRDAVARASRDRPTSRRCSSIGLSSPERRSELVDDLQRAARRRSRRPRVLFVSGRDGQDRATSRAPEYATAYGVLSSDAARERLRCCKTSILAGRCCSSRVRRSATTRAGAVQLLNVSYDPTRELYREFNERVRPRSGSPTPASKSRCRCRTAARAARRAPSSTGSMPTS